MIQNGREVVLEARNVTKIFPGVVANKDVNLTLHRGEVVALLGENGAGKTTLMNILYGLYHQDGGEILVDGEPVRIKSPNEAIRRGIGMVHQHFMLVPVFTVVENIVLGTETTRGATLDLNHARARIRELAERYGLRIDPDAYVKDLSVGQQQRVEIVKALYRNARILILDEPTAVLTPQEADELFVVLRELVAQGTSIIFISHKLREVLAIADRVVVLRRGEVVGETTPAQATPQSLAEMMVGRSVTLQVAKHAHETGQPILEVQNLGVADDRGQASVEDVSFTVRAGEVLGLAGVQGNGQTELVECLTGLRPAAHGRVFIAGRDVTNATPRAIFEAGTGHVPEDRQEHGLVLTYSVADNFVLNRYYRPPFAHGIQIDQRAIHENAVDLIEKYDVRTPGPSTPVGSLSGGNKQKVIIARELSRPLKLLVASQPTRGVDVGSIEFIHKNIIAERDAGTAVLLVSAELDEILALSDRIAVMYKGRIVDIVDARVTNREALGLMMAGVTPDEGRGAREQGTGNREQGIKVGGQGIGVAGPMTKDTGSEFEIPG
jgi:simple sugar transport system ATP-binding protein